MSDTFPEGGTPPAYMDTEQDAPASPPARPVEEKRAQPIQLNKLFVRPIGFDVTREHIEQHFGEIGPVSDVQVMRGYAFVTYENADDASKAFDQLSNSDFAGQVLTLEFAKARAPLYRIRVGNLPEGALWQDLKDFVREKLGVTPSFTKTFRDNEANEYAGAVEVSLEDEFRKALEVLNGADYQGQTVLAVQDTRLSGSGRRGGRGDFRGRGRGDRGRRDFRGRGDYGRNDYGRGDYGRGDYGRDRDYGRDHDDRDLDRGYRGRGGFRGGRGRGYDRDNYGRDSRDRDLGYNRDREFDRRDSYGRDGRESYGRDSYGDRDGREGREQRDNYRDGYERRDHGRDSYDRGRDTRDRSPTRF